MKNNKAVTLVALIITIIILLILAGVVIAMTVGDDGIINKSQQAVDEYKKAEYQEKIDLSRDNALVDKKGIITIDDLINQIYKDNIVAEGSIEKIDENKASLTTKEGYEFIITANKTYKKGPAIPLGNIELFAHMEKNGYTIDDLYRYGIAVTRSGRDEYSGLNDLYSLGMGSGTNTNRNTFTLTIDFDTLAVQYGMNKNAEGISVDYYLQCYTHSSGYTTWVEPKIVAIYANEEKKEVTGEKIEASNQTKSLDTNITLNFDKNKEVKEIQIIINMLDTECGDAQGYIKNINILGAMSKSNFEIYE